MREVAKSMLGFSWAVSLFGFQQVSKLLVPSSDAGVTASEFDTVSREVQSHLSETVAEQFRAADEWQRRVVDAVFDARMPATLDPKAVAAALDPRRVVQTIDPRGMIEKSVNIFRRSVDTVRAGAAPEPSSPEPAQ
jgi:hypothetical protein